MKYCCRLRESILYISKLKFDGVTASFVCEKNSQSWRNWMKINKRRCFSKLHSQNNIWTCYFANVLFYFVYAICYELCCYLHFGLFNLFNVGVFPFDIAILSNNISNWWPGSFQFDFAQRQQHQLNNIRSCS